MVVVIAIGAIAYVRYQNNNSYDYQIEMAENGTGGFKAMRRRFLTIKTALTLSPNDINARAAMAEIYLARKEYDSALVLEMEISTSIKEQRGYQGLITIYDAKGQYDKTYRAGVYCDRYRFIRTVFRVYCR